ncbi:MAG: ygfZ [Gammaproteobacteria bacterium]|jgi:folate-binding protein YgfZ|nr:ygfZ [Gammaproteobacteria bacterium]
MHQQWQDFLKNYTHHTQIFKEQSIVNLSELGLLCVEGIDAKQFLQGQLTCDLNQITLTQTRLGAYCNIQGRVTCVFRLFYYQERYYLQMPKSMVSIILEIFKKYAVFFKVTLSDASDSFICIGYNGNQLQDAISNIPNHIDEIIESDNLLILKLINHFEIFGQLAPICTLWDKLMVKNHYIPSESWKYLAFKENRPTVYPETSGQFLPHDINLPQLNAISFNKGCYMGQEIIARMHYKGKLKNQLYYARVVTEHLPQRGADIYDEEKNAGMIVDYYKTGDHTYILQIIAMKAHDLFLDQNKLFPLHAIDNPPQG